MDFLYLAILIAFYGLISALAVGCSRLQKRKAGTRPRNSNPATASAPIVN